MGIMNKMKTVAINQMTWGYWEPTKKFYANLVGPEAVPNTLNLACDGYTAQRGGTSGTSLIDKGIGIHNNGLSIYIRNDSFNGDTSAFLASEGDKTITYETIDSVEEKIVSPKVFHMKGVGWAVRPQEAIDYINTLPAGQYKAYLRFQLVEKGPSYQEDRELYGIRGNQPRWAGQTETSLTTTVHSPFNLTTESIGYIYGCGNNQTGTTGKANIDIMIATLNTEEII